jgi:xylulokinase
MGARTPIWDPAARGAFVGLSSRHSRAHLYRAILEGVALAFRQVQEIAGAGGGEPVTAIDGGARSPLWRQILADALRRPVRWSPTGGTAIGAAYLAARGVEYFRDFSGIQWWLHTSEPAIPGVAAERYDEIYVVYARLYEKLRSDFHALA